MLSKSHARRWRIFFAYRGGKESFFCRIERCLGASAPGAVVLGESGACESGEVVGCGEVVADEGVVW